MGVPTLFRWLRDRYPKMMQKVAEMPRIDNFYIDMNGMIHPCFHPEGRDAPRNEAEVFQEIFLYLDRLIEVVNPQKLIYMAIDGPAPRAKLNQQRLRRFVAAYESQYNAQIKQNQMSHDNNKFQQKGDSSSSELNIYNNQEAQVQNNQQVEKLDSNQITPGTPFMERLSIALRQYIASRQSTSLKHLKIIFSDASTPGEGEHKIMHFIRAQRQQPGYNPQTSHCIHGLDADLIMLALASHEPDFYIFREVVLLDKQDTVCQCCGEIIKKDSSHESRCPNTDHPFIQHPIVNGKAFHFMSIRLFRDYLFRDFASKLSDFDRNLDDFVFLCFLSGNDFLPHIDCMRINDDAIIRIIDVYRKLYVMRNQFITNSGQVDFYAFLPFLSEFALMERNILLSSERRNNMIEASIRDKNCGQIQVELDHEQDPAKIQELNKRLQMAREMRPIEITAQERNEYYKNIQIEKDDKITLAVQYISSHMSFSQPNYREAYYKKKSQQEIEEMCYQFLRGMYWVCQYYCNQIYDWSYYYPYHEAPLITDIYNYLKNNMQKCQQIPNTFNRKSRPFSPYEQLLAVLPPHSHKALPKEFHPLLLDTNSPLEKFYPNKFKIDISGKSQLYQGTVLLPFIDEELLRKEFNKVFETLNEEDKNRNMFVSEKLYFNIDTFPQCAKIIARITQKLDIQFCLKTVERQDQKIYIINSTKDQMLPGQYISIVSPFFNIDDDFNVLFNKEKTFEQLVEETRDGQTLTPLYSKDEFPKHMKWVHFINKSANISYCDMLFNSQFRNYTQLQKLSINSLQISQQEWDNSYQKRIKRTEKAFENIRPVQHQQSSYGRGLSQNTNSYHTNNRYYK